MPDEIPVSVVVPTIKRREKFLNEKCIPSILANGNVELIVVNGEGIGSLKRNIGLAKATRTYVLFVDDDCILRPQCVERMLGEIQKVGPSFVYSDYERIVLPGVQSRAPAGRFSAGPFNVKRLKKSNYINTVSLIRRDICPRWDEKLLRFQDWDFWLTVVLAGGVGGYIPEVLYELWQIDVSVTNVVKANPYIEMITFKHKLNRR